MNRQLSRLILAAAGVILLVGIYWSVSDACTFTAFVRDPNQQFNDDEYDIWVTYMPRTAWLNGANDGFSVSWYPYPQPFPPSMNGHRWNNDVQPYDYQGNPSTPYANATAEASGDNSTVVICHSRNANNPYNWDNPHPFVYGSFIEGLEEEYQYGIMGKPYAFIHNGSLEENPLWNNVNVAFSALDLFNHRTYAGWQNPSEIVDSELLVELIMKYLLAQYNYYWYGPSNEPPLGFETLEQWAIHKAAYLIDIDDDNSSINGVLTDGSQVWALAKSDGIGAHTVGYKTISAPYYCGEIASYLSALPTGHGFTRLVETPPGYVVQLSGQAGEPPTLRSMSGNPSNPTELRINSRSHSVGDQKAPAISVSETDGSWTAVWVSDNDTQCSEVFGRWYNQMGMAEADQFKISTNWPIEISGRPAIAHSDNGQIITVVWTEIYTTPNPLNCTAWDYLFYSRILRRTYDWDQETHSWEPRDEGVIVDTHDSETGLSNPTIAYDQSGNYAIAWEEENTASSISEIHAKAFNGNGTVLMEEQTITPDGNDHEPDIAFVGSPVEYVVFAIVYHTVDEEVYYRRVVLLRLEPSQHFLPLVEDPPQNGCHASVARLRDGEFFVAYNSQQIIQVDYFTTGGDEITLEYNVSGEDTDLDDSRPDIATRRSDETDETYYICYEIDGGENDLEIRCARGEVIGETPTLTPEEGTVNQYHTDDQKLPVIAIAPEYPINPDPVDPFYGHHTNSNPALRRFEVRRMIVWQTDGEDGYGWGIAGQFRGIRTDDDLLFAWSANDPFVRNTPRYLPPVVYESMTVSNPLVYMISNVDVKPGATLTFTSGVTVYAVPGCSLRVAGTLDASGCHFTQADPANRWAGIYVTGSATLSGCTIDGATTGITTHEAIELMVDGCTIQNNGVGVYVYDPPGSGTPEISNCTITNNDAEGISLFSTQKADIHDCPNISSNGTDGILLKDSYANISDNYFTANTGYGVYCYGSSPTLYCNSFIEDKSGEMYLVNGSYPVLWSSEEQDGGSNTFEATDRTLITMMDSYPIVAGGLNLFTIYGKDGYYMADMSDNVPVHNIKMNEWSEDPPPASTFFPEDHQYWAWYPSDDYVVCGSPKEGSSNAAQILFEQGYTAEMAGNTTAASTNYMATIAQYPDSSWAQVSAVRLFENQRQIGSGYSGLGTYYATVEINHPEDTCLVETVQDLGTQTLVEAAQYNPALSNYEQIMTNPPSFVDSAYAAVDYAITVMREQYDSLDAPHPVVTAQTIRDLMQALHQIIPQVPEANHQNYMRPPESYVLEQNYPNPFNASTTLRYAVPSSGLVRLTIYNIIGQKVATLVDRHQDAGYHSVIWNCTNLASGVYFYRIEANDFVDVKKMVLLR